jgi:hypothetical protein
MIRACSAYGREEKFAQVFGWKARSKEASRKNNIKIDFREMLYVQSSGLF